MTDNDMRRIIVMWNSNLTIEQIYQALPYKRREIKEAIDRLRYLGHLPPKPSKKAEAIKKIGEAWESGTQDIDELCDIFGYTRETVLNYLSKSGVKKGKIKPKIKPKPMSDKVQEIAREIQSGTPLCEIAKKYGVSRQYIHQIKKRIGL